jgi:hypothetical protein
MVAEPTLFLSSDELVQVRAHTTKKGVKIYCIRDFIRMISNKPLKPSEALIYWMSAASSKELRSEHDIQDQYAITFLGPYEPRNMCITAGGLLILFHYMEKKWGLVDVKYRDEIQQRLMELAEGNGAEYVWDFDDGEVDTMSAAKEEAVAKGEGLDGPPDSWKFFFDDKGERGLNPVMEARLAECVDAVEEMQVEVGALMESSNAKVDKLDKKTSFSLKDLIGELELKIEPELVPAICKTVCTRFREQNPGSETFTKKRRTFFYADNKDCLAKLIQEEYLKYVMRKADEEFEDSAGN